ncbi:Divalent-cation tolerance protein CutA [uncultured archaeon]|nr:Divalent-cation tolerance protein CutA [uncultured archaeon]
MYLIYCPFPNMNEAKKAGKALVEEQLSCCVNVLKSYSSIYKWNGKLAEESEFVLIAKTSEKSVDALEQRLKQLHSYRVPEILRLKVDGLNAEYKEWAKALC